MERVDVEPVEIPPAVYGQLMGLNLNGLVRTGIANSHAVQGLAHERQCYQLSTWIAGHRPEFMQGMTYGFVAEKGRR